MAVSRMRAGRWPSDWSATRAATASADFAELEAGHGGLYWVRFTPEDGRCRLWFHDGEAARPLTPEGYSIRSRVYEYGGGAFCLTARGWAFVNEADQQLYHQACGASAPRRLTDRPSARHGDLRFDAAANRLLAVEESREGGALVHRLVAIELVSGVRRVLAEGADFYASPAASPDGRQLAWIEWDRPAQPWVATRLMLAARQAGGGCSPRCLAGQGGGESLQQARFAPDGTLWVLGDRHGWWQPWSQADGTLAAAPAEAADHAPAPWQLGTRSWLPLARGVLFTRFEDGFGALYHREGLHEQRLAGDFTRFRQLCADASAFYAIAAAPDRLPAVIAIDRASHAVRVLCGGELPLGEADLSRPEPLRLGSEEPSARAFVYPPANAHHALALGERPPLVVFLHGGPTSASYPVFDPRIQFWTQRGFLVADLNYRGSSGFGRAMRLCLEGAWGERDVEDACTLVEILARRGWIDPARAFIRGASAGGYTTLCTLAFRRTFRAGASLYGVSDPLALRRATHKFEGDYLDWLIGDPQRDAERYARRTPLHHAAAIEVPVIFFQGGRDPVVVPEQTESMVRALRAAGREVEYHLYPDEGHGFRQAAHLADALEKEWAFYTQWLDAP